MNHTFDDFFPYEIYRTQQKNTIQAINQGILERIPYILSSPNGTGKSSIGLASVLPIVYEKGKKLVYLCRTNQQNDRVIKELKKINKKQSFVNGIAIRGRNNMCINEEFLKDKPSMKELMQLCQKARQSDSGCKYYEIFNSEDYEENRNGVPNNNEKLSSIIARFYGKVIDTDDLIEICKEEHVCPYYVIKNLLSKMDVIVCNYLWMFNPIILKYSFLRDLQSELEDIILIIDECHNLPENILEINEEKLSLNTVEHCNRLLRKYTQKISQLPYFRAFHHFVSLISEYLNNMKDTIKNEIKQKKKYITTAGSFDIQARLISFLEQMEKKTLYEFRAILEAAKAYASTIHISEEIELGRRLRNWIQLFINFWIHWLNVIEDKKLLEINYSGYFAKIMNKNVKVFLHIKPFDPVRYIEPVIADTYASLHMSGTIDSKVYADLTGLCNLGKQYKSIELDMQFDKKNRLVMIDLDVTSRSADRELEMYRKYNQKIKEILLTRPGNTGIFVVSYNFINSLKSNGLKRDRLDYIIKSICQRELFEEKRGVDSSQNAEMIKEFKNTPNAVLLGVFGGRNSEGEDFPGEEMETVINVGFPFAPPSPYIDKKKEYFDSKFKNLGWEYAIVEPAIRKANQAAGRPIRDKEDKVVIALLGKRYKTYRSSLSKWLKEKGVLKYSGNGHGKLSNLIQRFMSKQNE